jgi:acyl dehydratase
MNEIAWRDRFFEDFSVGDVCKHRNSRTVVTYDNLLFTLLTQNPAPLHLNHDFVAAAGHAKNPLNSTLTLALVTGQSVADLTPNVMTNLGWTDV